MFHADPTVFHESPQGFSYALFGRATGSWRTRNDDARRAMARFVAHHGVRQLVGLPADFSATVLPVGTAVQAAHYEESNGVAVWHGCAADGLFDVKKGTAVWIGSADCPTVILTDGVRLAVLHAGLGSLVVRHWLDGERALRGRRSVVDRAVALFPQRATIVAHIVCGIGRNSFIFRLDHPVYGESNQRLFRLVNRRVAYGGTSIDRSAWLTDDERAFSLDIGRLIEQELLAHGIFGSRVSRDGIDTYADGNGHLTWWSQRRPEMAADGKPGRNGVVVWW